ncbi:MAG TPA: TonB-dependent receptor [Vicinamibacterales bacterium]|nr:TonB-dependent receptor [Vicinamibacterales bacterium]
MRRIVRSFAVLAALIAVATPALAQVQTGSILAKAVDEQGAATPGVAVTISSPVLSSGTMTGATDASGVYRFPSLTPGTYTVKFELQGFQTIVRENVDVSVGQTTPVDIQLKVAAVAETVTVSGASPVVDTTSANVNVTLNQQLLQATPGGRDIWALTEYKVPGLVMSRPDVGGTSGGLQGTYTARGTTSQQNSQYLNGVNVGDPSAIGAAGFYYDFDAFDEIQVSVGAHDITVPTSGVFLNMITKSGGNTWRGQGAYFYEGSGMQSGNVDSTLQSYGFSPITGAVAFVSDATFNGGGPLSKNVRFFGAFRDWRVHVNTPAAFSETLLDQTNMTSALGNLTYQVNDRNKLTAFYTRQYYKKPNRFLTSSTVPSTNFDKESVSNEDDVFDVVQGLWNSVVSQRFFLDARFSFNNINFPLKFNGTSQSLTDLSTGILLNNEASQSLAIRRRFEGNATANYYIEQALGGRHEFKFGFDEAHAPVQTETDRWGDVALTYRSLPSGTTPAGSANVTLYNTPVISQSATDVLSFFVQDAYIIKKLTVTAGGRLERLNSYLPAQSSPATQWAAAGIGGFPSLPRTFSASSNIINWWNFGPRVSGVYDVNGDGITALRASAARYYYVLNSAAVNPVNLNATYSELYTWNDKNGDLQFQPGEQTGTPVITSATSTSFDPGFSRPYTNEYTAGVDREILKDTKLSATFTYRQEKNLQAYVNTALPNSQFVPRTTVVPGPDGVVGTADDTTIGTFNRPSAANQILINNDPTFVQTYKGVELTATKRMSNRWQMLAGLTLSRSRQDNKSEAASTTEVNWGPNALINTSGPITTDVPVQFKLTGTYVLPYDIALAGNFRSQSGTPYNMQQSVAMTFGGSATVNVQPYDSDRLPALTTLDLQASKTFNLATNRSLNVVFAVSNITNANTVWSVRTLTGVASFRQAGSPTGAINTFPQFGAPTNILGPRIARIGATFRF